MSLNNKYTFDKIQPVVDVVKNTLLTMDDTLAAIDFDQLILVQLPIKVNDPTVRIRFDTKAVQTSAYKLESNQTFLLNRLSTDAALRLAGFEQRTFKKADFTEVNKYLSQIGHFTKIAGDIDQAAGNATYAFSLANNSSEDVKAHFIDCAKHEKFAHLFGVLFTGSVEFVFEGDKNIAPPQPEPDPYLDLAPFFKNRNLGKILLSGSTNK